MITLAPEFPSETSDMPLTAEAQAVADRFAATLNPDRRRNFALILNDAPGLADEINAAVSSGRLRNFAPMPAGANAGAQYDPDQREIRIPLSGLDSPGRGRRYDPTEMIFATAHECRHANNANLMESATSDFDRRIGEIAASRQNGHDYTEPLADMLQAHRRNEASSHIAGYNALLSHVRTEHPQPTLEQLYRANPERMSDFIERSNATPPTYTARPGLTLAPDMSITQTPGNIEAMGRHYYDRSASRGGLGDYGQCDYQNLYATEYIGRIVRAERTRPGIGDEERLAMPYNPQYMALNMPQLRLDEVQLEREGLNLGVFGGHQAYVDTGQSPPAWRRFDHTIETHRHIAQGDAATSPPGAAHPAIRRAAEAIDRSPNIGPNDFGDDRARVAAGIAMHAAKEQVRTDHIVMNDQRSGLIAVQGALGDPAAVLSSPLPLAKAQATDLPEAQAVLQRLQPAEAGRQAALDQAPQREQPVLAASGPAR